MIIYKNCEEESKDSNPQCSDEKVTPEEKITPPQTAKNLENANLISTKFTTELIQELSKNNSKDSIGQSFASVHTVLIHDLDDSFVSPYYQKPPPVVNFDFRPYKRVRKNTPYVITSDGQIDGNWDTMDNIKEMNL